MKIIYIATLYAVLGAGNAFAGSKEIEFTSDPSQEDFERIMQPVINPIRQTVASDPGVDGNHLTFSVLTTHVAIPDEANDISKSYFRTGGVGGSMDMTRLNVQVYDKHDTPKGHVHSGFILTLGDLPYSGQQLMGGTIVLGTESVSVRVGYSTLYGSDEFAACSENAEIVAAPIQWEKVLSVYVGGGAAKTGAAAWWSGMAEEKRRVWFDRYGIVGVGLPFGKALTGTNYSPFSAGAEIQYSTSPKQTLASFRLSLSL